MSDSQQPPASESSGTVPTKKTTKVRRISNPLLKKARKIVQAKVSPVTQIEAPELSLQTPTEPVAKHQSITPKTHPIPSDQPVQAAFDSSFSPSEVETQIPTMIVPRISTRESNPVDSVENDNFDSSSHIEPSDSSESEHEWPEPEPASSGRQEGQESSKRKRRRKKNKNNQHQGTPQHQQQPSGVEEAEMPQITTIVESSDPPVRHQPQPPRQRQDPEVVAKYAWKIYLAEVSEEGVALIGDGDAKDLARRCFRLAEFFLEEQARRR